MRVFFFKPFSIDKKIGEVYNSHCSIVPNSEDWICIMDYDSMILCPETFQVIESAINRYPETAIFGAMTNRIGYSHQRRLPHMDVNANMREHTQISIDLAIQFKDGECFETKIGVAGFFMLFRKSYWEKSPFQSEIFDQKRNLFDYNFCRYAIKNGLPVRVIKGAYLWHSYRILKESYKDTSHLKSY